MSAEVLSTGGVEQRYPAHLAALLACFGGRRRPTDVCNLGAPSSNRSEHTWPTPPIRTSSPFIVANIHVPQAQRACEASRPSPIATYHLLTALDGPQEEGRRKEKGYDLHPLPSTLPLNTMCESSALPRRREAGTDDCPRLSLPRPPRQPSSETLRPPALPTPATSSRPSRRSTRAPAPSWTRRRRPAGPGARPRSRATRTRTAACRRTRSARRCASCRRPCPGRPTSSASSSSPSARPVSTGVRAALA